ncbi:MAG TPA: hypothetical protein VGI78_25260 [Acetobacteraceae bacterium]|jgi:hypothetical protein
MLEERGIPSVALGAVRAQMEKTRPPRGLWTAAQLGRPLGEPEDKAFQRRVLLAALRLLERTDGPVILEDFPEDPPGLRDTPGWQAPALPAMTVTPDAPSVWSQAFAEELALLLPLWRQARQRFGRTTTGVSFQAPEAWPGFATRFLAGELPIVAGHDTPALALRFLCDDVKALYGEAAQAVGAAPSSRQVDAWFWRQTVAGRLLIALREAASTSENNALKTVGGRFFVPVPWLPQ